MTAVCAARPLRSRPSPRQAAPSPPELSLIAGVLLKAKKSAKPAKGSKKSAKKSGSKKSAKPKAKCVADLVDVHSAGFLS